MVDGAALPRFGARLTTCRHGPEAPHLLAGGLIEGGNEAADPFVAAGDSGYHEVVHDERRTGTVVVLAPVGHRGLPQERAGGAAESHQVGVVRRHEHALARNRHPAVDAAGRDSRQAAGPRPAIVPDLASAAGIQRVDVVGRRHVHHAVDDHRRDLQLRGVGQREGPLGPELRHVGRRDLREGAIAVAVAVSVVGRPIDLRGDLAVAARRAFAQQVHRAIVAEQLQLSLALVEDHAFERSPVRQPHRRATGPGGRGAQRPKKGHEVRGFGARQIRERRHAGAGHAVTNDRFELLIAAQRHPRQDRRSKLTAAACRSMTRRAPAGKHLPARLSRLSSSTRGQQHSGDAPSDTSEARHSPDPIRHGAYCRTPPARGSMEARRPPEMTPRQDGSGLGTANQA